MSKLHNLPRTMNINSHEYVDYFHVSLCRNKRNKAPKLFRNKGLKLSQTSITSYLPSANCIPISSSLTFSHLYCLLPSHSPFPISSHLCSIHSVFFFSRPLSLTISLFLPHAHIHFLSRILYSFTYFCF